MPDLLTLETTWGRNPAPAGGEGQLAYLLIDVSANAGAEEVPAQRPLNLCMVLDHSGSMSGPKLQNLKEAVSRVIDELNLQDTLAIIIFDERAKVIVPSTQVSDKEALKAAVAGIREAGGTKMSSGLTAGLEEVRRAAQPGTTSRILLLTDGQTWGDAPECERLAAEAGQAGIPISAFGVGADEDWSVGLLDSIAQKSNGQADYIAQPADILASFRGTVQSMQNTVVQDVVVSLQLAAGVSARAIYRITPMIGRVPPQEPSPNTVEVTVGEVQRDRPSTVLAELLIPARKPGEYRLLRASVRTGANATESENVVTRDVLLRFEAGARDPGDPRVMNLVEKATAFKLQTRALQEAEVGNVVEASRNLRSAATRLLNLGETELAADAEREAQQLEQRGQMSAHGTKKLTFATRKLALDDVPGCQTSTRRLEEEEQG